ncbi:MAG: cytochrome P450 [Polyangia bacterium]
MTADGNVDPARLPPELPGLPLLGHALAFMKDPVALVERGQRRLGNVFSMRMGGKRIAVLIGPRFHRFFFQETDHALSMREVYRFFIPMLGDKMLLVADPEEYAAQHAVILPHFKGPQIASYIKAMERETRDWLGRLGGSGRFELIDAFGHLAMFIAIRAFIGDAFREQKGHLFWDAFCDLAAGMDYVLPPNLPLPKFRRRDRARRVLCRLIQDELDGRRARSAPKTEYAKEHVKDYVDVLMASRYPDGRPLPDDVIITIVLGMIFAGFDNTIGHTSWALVQLLQNPAFLDSVRSELTRVLPGDGALDLETLRELELLEHALKETERMYPTVPLLLRQALTDCEVEGFRIPAGWLVLIAPAAAHRLPEVFSHPDVYDPLRFSRERAEDRATPYSLVGFGGGARRCIGQHFAYTEMKVILALLLRSQDLELASPSPRPQPGRPNSRPAPPCWIRYASRRSSPQGERGPTGVSL